MVIFAVKTITFVQILCRTFMTSRLSSSFITVSCTAITMLTLASGLFCSCSSGGRYAAVTGFTQGGTYSVKFNTDGVKAGREEVMAGIDSILTLVDTTLSGYNKSSILSRFNAGEKVVLNELFCDIYSFCQDIYDETGGCVDVGSGPLFDIWGFGFSTDSLPSDDLVRETLATCGISRLPRSLTSGIQLSGSDISGEGCPATELPLPELNFNAVAQGYTCDMVADYLHSLGVHDMLVDIGEIYCEGLNPSGKGWSIGVDRPVDGNDTPGSDLDGIWVSEGRSCGIVTSGNYRKFYMRNGQKYAHTIDPRTGYPVTHRLLSATVTAATAALADAYATYCMVIGLEEAQAFIASRDDLEAYLIYVDAGEMKEWASPGFTLRSASR